jgi:hypothetical protein
VFKSLSGVFCKAKKVVQDMSTKNYWVCASFIKVSLMKVTYEWEQIFHHTLHIYHQIWTKFDKGSEHNATERLLIPSKPAHGRQHHYLGCKWNYMYLCTDTLFRVSLSFLLLHHHSSLGIGLAISCKYCYSCMFKYQLAGYHYSTLHKHHITFTFFLTKDHS